MPRRPCSSDHLYWSKLTCTVQFMLTVVPTTGYGEVTFKILRAIVMTKVLSRVLRPLIMSPETKMQLSFFVSAKQMRK